MASSRALKQIHQRVVECVRCPELREYCEEVGRTKRKAYQEWEYWARPVPGFGDSAASIMIVGLAPAAHGANRTGRMFTGDRSGDFLYAALHRAGLANQPRSTDRNDGLALVDTYISAACRCAPPGNKPTTIQQTNCMPHLMEELRLMQPRVLIALGAIGWNALLAALRNLHVSLPRRKPTFGHGESIELQWPENDPKQRSGLTVLGCYHVSQQNTFTGRLTEPMLDAVICRAKNLVS